MNFVTKTNKNMNSSTSSKSEDINKNKENFTNFFNEDIIYENFEEFNIDNKIIMKPGEEIVLNHG